MTSFTCMMNRDVMKLSPYLSHLPGCLSMGRPPCQRTQDVSCVGLKSGLHLRVDVATKENYLGPVLAHNLNVATWFETEHGYESKDAG